jgi:hypothetical protein
MADTKISELASATALSDSDMLCGVNSGTTRKFSLLRIREFFQTTFDGLYSSKEHTHSKLSNGAYVVTIPSTIKKNDSFMLQSEKTASNIGYSNAASKMDAENVQTALDEVESNIKNVTDNKGKAGGYAELGTDGIVPTSQLPAFVSNVSVTVSQMTISITATKSKS